MESLEILWKLNTPGKKKAGDRDPPTAVPELKEPRIDLFSAARTRTRSKADRDGVCGCISLHPSGRMRGTRSCPFRVLPTRHNHLRTLI